MSECDHRKEFLVEGTHQIQEAVATGWPLRTVFWTDEWSGKHHELVGCLNHVQERYCVSEAILKRIATTLSPDGVVAIASFKRPPAEIQFELGVALVAIQDPGNMGTLIRAAVAAGADGIFATPDSVSPYHPKVIRASAGQWFRCQPRLIDWKELLQHCRQAGIQTLAASATGVCYWESDLNRPTLLILGNEGAGLSGEILEMVDTTVAVPMQKNVESLNVAMTGTLVLYEAFRQRNKAI